MAGQQLLSKAVRVVEFLRGVLLFFCLFVLIAPTPQVAALARTVHLLETLKMNVSSALELC